MKKLVVFTLLFCINSAYAETKFTVEIHNVIKNDGIIYIGIYFNERSFKNKSPDISLQINSINDTIFQEIPLVEGEYVIGIHQDTNGNGEMDYGIFGIPKEPFGFSNMRGKIPGNYNQLKFRVNKYSERIVIPLVKY
jgi:uncharacterized protein (DUF2141 family)